MRRRTCATAAAVALLASLVVAPGAGAITAEEELFRVGGTGTGAGSLTFPQGVASDPVTGHIYVIEGSTRRVSEFTPWGDFVKAFGWDVAPGPVNEQQEVRVRAETGQFRLSFGAATTTDLAFDAPDAEVEAALNALSTIGGAGASVSVKAVPGTTSGTSPFIYVVTFKASLAGINVAQLVASNGTTEPSGGVPSTVLEVRTRADGHTATTGFEACTGESLCKAGVEGPGAGQLAAAKGVAVDAAGNVYVRETTNNGNGRVQKFDSAGRFLLMFGGEVNKTTSGNRCTKAQLEGGNVCGKGVAGSANGQFGASFSGGIALGSGGKLFVGDIERIQRFNLEGEYEASVPISVPVSAPPPTVHSLALAPGSGDFYATVGGPSGSDFNVRILGAVTGAEKGQLKGTGAGQGGGVASDAAGNVFFADGKKILQFGPDRTPLSPPSCCEAGTAFPDVGTSAIGDLYTTSGADGIVTAFGPPPVSLESPPLVAPSITAQFASSVGRKEATVVAEINPQFFTDTRYYVQYGTGECSSGGCTGEAPLPPGTQLTAKAVKAAVRTAGVALAGLEPGTTYNYRFVAQSTGGGPAFGAEASFTTYPAATRQPPCANDAFRVGPGARLPDCRAYEMVSPVDKNNGDIRALLDLPSYTTALSQSAVDGGRFTYSSYRGFGDPEAAPYTNQYLASRAEGTGWSSQPLAIPQTSKFDGKLSFENRYKSFSADLCSSWSVTNADSPPAPPVTMGFSNVYQHENCGGGGLHALIDVQPTNKEFHPIVLGTSAATGGAAFIALDTLTPEAVPGVWQAYYASAAALRLLCLLPNGAPSGGNCSVGMGETHNSPPGSGLVYQERLSSVSHALSDDGGKVYWTNSAGNEAGPGKIYLRLNPGEEQSELSGEECLEPEKACTVRVSETINSQPARFLGASANGSKALFEITAGALTGNLYLFDAETASSTLIAGDTRGVAGASEDLSRVYFVSEEVLPGTSGASPGQPNLYLDEGGAENIFIATLAAGETGDGSGFSDTTSQALYHTARASADGRVLAFTSTERLTGYDNTDLASGKADGEVFLYEVGADGPVCISCNPSGARPAGQVLSYLQERPTAAWLATPDSPLYFPQVLADGGRHLFFNSFDGLLPRDTNGQADVYEWQSASDQAACDQIGAELYVAKASGCLSLISTGESPQNSEFLDSSASGDDAFFVTNASLLPRDPGLIDVYDARVGGGVPEPPLPPVACQGETCQPPIVAPSDSTPASSSYVGPEDETQKQRKNKKKAKKKQKSKHKKQQKKKKSASARGGRR